MPKWTNAQQNAINARNSNILVSAAAGSGKTAVLVERVVKLITDDKNGTDIDKLLIVTFTNAAASEMKNRISKSLNKIISKNPNDTNALRQLSLLPNAKICTIDSFCMNLVRENFFKLDIAQDFKILDDSQRVLIEQTAIDNVVESLYDDDMEEFRSLVELLSSTKSDEGFTDAVRRINDCISAQPFPFVWLENATEFYNPEIDLDKSRIKEIIFNEISQNILCAKELIQNSIDSLGIEDELFDKYSTMLENDLSIFENIEKKMTVSWNEVKFASENVKFGTMPSKRGYISPSKSIITNNRTLYKEILTKEIVPLLSATSDDYKADCEYLYPILKMLCRVIKMYNDAMLDIKKDLNSYSFSDIEHFAINLLFSYENGKIIRTELAKEYEDTFDEILVDEYQDTNTAQDTLFEMLSNGHNRFMVGDVKQSIYRFRLAMPQIFNNKKDTFDDYSPSNDSINQKIILDKNFRSRDGICEYTNFLFKHLMTRRVGELDYTASEYLNYGASYDDSDIPCAQINLVQTPEGYDADEYEAMQVAKLIIDKIKSKELVKDSDEYRPIRYSDFAILFRTTKNRMPVFANVLSQYGIPVVSDNKINLFENNEVAILVSLLRVIDNPVQDIPLLATLMSVFYGYTADDISLAKVNFAGNSLYASISRDKEHFGNFLSDLEKYRKYASSMSVESFIRQIISDTSYLSIISAMGNCEQRRLNVMKLIDIAKRFDAGENVGLTAFMRYVDSIIDSKLNVESASVSHVGEDSVALMSIHQSKGLEFPVVILAGASHKYNTEDSKNLIQLNSDIGIGLKVYDEELMYRYDSLQYSGIKYMNTLASVSENLRVLYVAVTRAKEQFITFVSDKSIATHVNNLAKRITRKSISSYVAKRVISDGDFILLTALLHRDGGILRKMCEFDVEVDFSSDFDLSINMCENTFDSDTNDEISVVANEDIVALLDEKLSFEYNRRELSGFTSKRTASSLDEKEQNYKYFAKTKPAFLNSSGLTSAEKGTAMHAFMQYCNYNNARDNLNSEIDRLCDEGFITQQQADSLNREKLNKLFQSEFANRIFSSDKVYREIKISSFVPVNELEKTDFTDSVLIQGIADCVFEENGELFLVDYKTDRIDNEEELLDMYKNQVAFYKNAVAKTLSKPVKEAMLYSFSLNKCCVYK